MDALRLEWGFHRKFRFRDFLGRWERFVADIAGGYELTLDDYTRELAVRDAIETLAGSLPSRLKTELEAAMARLDATFLESTQELAKPLVPSADGLPLHPRWFRLPSRVAPVDHDVAHTWLGYADVVLIQWPSL